MLKATFSLIPGVLLQVIVASIIENWYQTALSLTPFAAAALSKVEGALPIFHSL